MYLLGNYNDYILRSGIIRSPRVINSWVNYDLKHRKWLLTFNEVRKNYKMYSEKREWCLFKKQHFKI